MKTNLLFKQNQATSPVVENRKVFNPNRVLFRSVKWTNRKLTTLQRPIINVLCRDGVIRKSYNGVVINYNALVLFKAPNLALVPRKSISVLPSNFSLKYPLLSNMFVDFKLTHTNLHIHPNNFHTNSDFSSELIKFISSSFELPFKIQFLSFNGRTILTLDIFNLSQLQLAFKQIHLQYHMSNLPKNRTIINDNTLLNIIIFKKLGTLNKSCFGPNKLPLSKRLYSTNVRSSNDLNININGNLITINGSSLISNPDVKESIIKHIYNDYVFPLEIGLATYDDINNSFDPISKHLIEDDSKVDTIIDEVVSKVYSLAIFDEQLPESNKKIVLYLESRNNVFNTSISPCFKTSKREFSTSTRNLSTNMIADAKLSKSGLYINNKRNKVILNVDLGKLNVLQDFDLFKEILLENLSKEVKHGIVLKIAYLEDNKAVYKKVGKQFHICKGSEGNREIRW